MSKSSYTEEEIQQILHNLFIEKKRVMELQQQLQQVPIREVVSRKDGQLEVLQKMLEEAKKEASRDKQSLSEALEKLGETQKDETTVMREHREQIARQKQSLEKLAALLRDKERKIEELQQFEYSYKKGNEQKQQQQRELEELNGKWRQAEEAKTQLAKQLEDHIEHTQKLEMAIQFLREKAEAGDWESNQLQTEYQAANQTIEGLTHEIKAVKQKNVELTQQHNQEMLARRESEEELKLLYAQFEVLKGHVSESQDTLRYRDEALEETNQIIERLKEEKHQTDAQHAQKAEVFHQQIELHEREKQQLEDELRSAYSDRNEQEQRLKVAQQHLGKKVKETTLLTEQIEEQKKVIQDLEQNLAHATGKIHDLQNALEAQAQQEKRLQDQLNESLKSIENQMAKWEAKYFTVYEKWQETEMRNRELKTIEEKYHHLQSLLSNVGSFVGSVQPPALQMPVNQQKIAPRILIDSPIQEQQTEPRKATQSLFEMTQQPSKAKNSLFE